MLLGRDVAQEAVEPVVVVPVAHDAAMLQRVLNTPHFAGFSNSRRTNSAEFEG